MATSYGGKGRSLTEEAVTRARDEAVAAVLRRHGLHDKKFHNEAVVEAVAAEVAAAVAAVFQEG